jgi:hypothetical protein
MQMSKEPKGLVNKTIYFVKVLDGLDKTKYIEEIIDDYEFVRSQHYPKATVKKFYELFTKLIKEFGH